MVHTYNGILLSHKGEWNNAVCNNMDGPRDYHTKRSKPKTTWYHLYVELKRKKKTVISEPYIQNKNRSTDTENKQGTKEENQGMGINQ